MCDAWIDAPFGSPTSMPLDMENSFVHGVEGTRKWLVQPELTMVIVLGNRVRGVVVFETFSVYLVSSHDHLGLFLDEPPLVSPFVAPLS